MPRINTYTDNTSIEDDDKLLTYDTQGAATKLTAFSRIWTWIQSKIHAITASTSAWTASNDKVVVDRNGTLSRIDYSILAKAIVESYNGSTLAGSAQAVKTAIDALNSKSVFSTTPVTAIQSNADLDSFNTPGIYDCSSATIATTLSHCPLNTGFRLLVMSTGYTSIAYGMQVIISGSGVGYPRLWVRIKNGANLSDAWTGWYAFSISAVS